MSVSGLRAFACWMMIAVVPIALSAADSGPAMLYAKGTTWINGSTVPRSSAVFPGDMVQTKPDSMASINASGSNVVVMADSLVKFDGPAVSLEHGGLAVATSKGMSTHIGDVTVVPASAAGWTEFQVKQGSDGTVQVIAQKGDVNVNDGSTTSTVAQGQQTTVPTSSDKKKKRRKGGGAVPASEGSALDSPMVIYGGAAAVGGLLTWVLLQDSTPVSSAAP